MRTVEQAVGRWPGILKHFGLGDRELSGDHGPCPVCGGKDRFRFDDKDGRGTFFCSHCGAGNGMDLLMRVTGMGFKEAADAVDGIVGTVPEAPRPRRTKDKAATLALCQRLWRESRPVTPGDPVHLYLAGRIGGDVVINPRVIRFHPNLGYRHPDKRVTNHPAMLARVQTFDGTGTALWRTFLTADGVKASVPNQKKGLGPMPDGASVRLFEHDGTLGIAEGIETALAASKRFSVPVWSATCLNRLEAWIPPAGVKTVWVFGDNDTHGGGQLAAKRLYERLTSSGLKVQIRIPDEPGTDWADVTK